MMPQDKFAFIPGLPLRTSPRDQELVRATALSHTARVNHQRRKAREALQHAKQGSLLSPISRALVQAQSHGLHKKSGPASKTKDKPQEEQEYVNITGPLTILRKGNSDPFKSLAIAVTPRVNQVISFVKDVYLPAFYVTDTTTDTMTDTKFYRSIAAHNEWDEDIMVLSAESSAQSFIYAFLTAMGKFSHNDAFATDIYIAQRRSYNTLQARIQKYPHGDPVVLSSTIFLFAAEIFAGNIIQTTIHGKMLRAYLYERVQNEGFSAVKLSTWIHIVYYDSYFAQSQLHRPIFILESWVLDLAKQMSRPADKFMESIRSNFTSNLDDSLDHDLRRIFVMFRQLVWCWAQPNPITKEDSKSELSHLLLVQWIIINCHLLRAELVNYYINMQLLLEQKMTISTQSSLSGNKLYWSTQCCLALGLVLFVQPTGGNPIISGQELHRITEKLLMRLQTTVSLMLRTSLTVDSNMMQKYENAHLWVLFVSAQAEQMHSKDYLDPLEAWFNVAFGSLARRMCLFTWPMVRGRLERFFYHDALEPHPSTWVPKSLHVTSRN
jgi:hypothetical protein